MKELIIAAISFLLGGLIGSLKREANHYKSCVKCLVNALKNKNEEDE